MNSKDEARHSSLLETRNFCNIPANNTILTGDATFSADYNTYKGMLDTIEAEKQKSIAILIGFTIDKANKEGALIKDMIFISARIQVWASPTNNNRPDVAAAAAVVESKLPKLSDTIVLSKAKILKQIMIDNPSIVPTFVTSGRQTDFDTHISDYEGVIEMPETMNDDRAAHTQLMIQALKDSIKFRKANLLLDAKVFRESDPGLFGGFKQSMKIDDNPTVKLAANGHIKDTDDGTDISNVHILIAEAGVTTKSGEKGNFQFKSLPAGTYTIIFTKFGYQTVTRTIYVNDGERTTLNITMTKV